MIESKYPPKSYYYLIGEDMPSPHPRGVQPPETYIWKKQHVPVLNIPAITAARWVGAEASPEPEEMIIHYYEPTGHYNSELGYEYEYVGSSDGLWV